MDKNTTSWLQVLTQNEETFLQYIQRDILDRILNSGLKDIFPFSFKFQVTYETLYNVHV